MIKLFLLQPMILLSLHFPLAIDHRVIFPPQNEYQTFIPLLNLKEERKIKKRKKTLTPLSLSIISHDKLTKKGSYLIVGRSQNKSGVSFVRFRLFNLFEDGGPHKEETFPTKMEFQCRETVIGEGGEEGKEAQSRHSASTVSSCSASLFLRPYPYFRIHVFFDVSLGICCSACRAETRARGRGGWGENKGKTYR